MTGQTEDHEKCLRCGRKLHSRASRVAGFGKGCRAIIRAARQLAALVNFTRQQIADAVELIEDAAIIPAAIAGYFFTVSSDGTEIYQTAADICSCLASKECYHRAAVIMVTGQAA